MWEKVDQLWHQSPAFKLLGPIALIGAFLVMANMASQPAGQDLEARSHAKSASPLNDAYNNFGQAAKKTSEVGNDMADGAKGGWAYFKTSVGDLFGGSKKRGVPEPEPNSEAPTSTSGQAPAPAPSAPK